MIDPKREQEVWQRVMEVSAQAPACCKAPPKAAVTSEKVLELLCAELADAAAYEALACRVRGPGRQKLLQLSAQERQHGAKLGTVYYLMTGKKPCPDRTKRPHITCTQEELRQRYIQETAGAENYRALSEKAESFAEVFKELACQEESHARAVLAVLQLCL